MSLHGLPYDPYKPVCIVCGDALDMQIVVNGKLPLILTDVTNDAENSGMYCGWGCLLARAEEMAGGD